MEVVYGAFMGFDGAIRPGNQLGKPVIGNECLGTLGIHGKPKNHRSTGLRPAINKSNTLK